MEHWPIRSADPKRGRGIFLTLALLLAGIATASHATAGPQDAPDSGGGSAELTGEEQSAPADVVPAPPTEVVARDLPWDNGENVRVTWTASASAPDILGYRIERERTEEEQEEFIEEEIERQVIAAKLIATAEWGEEVLGENWDDRLDELTPEQRAEIRAIRETVGETARAEAEQWIEDNPDQVRWDLAEPLVPAEQTSANVSELERGHEYTFRVAAMTQGPDGPDDLIISPFVAADVATPTLDWFDGARRWLVLITLIFGGSVVAFIALARRGIPLKVRKIAGLEAVDEAVGRATEMGRPVLFVPGIQDVNEVQTIAGITILSRVARTAAEYDAKVEVPTARSLVMTTCRETVEASFLAAGRPDAYNADLIYYVTDEQFGYVAYLSGMMVREKPAACFYMGMFYAESLILAETGNAIGAIQVAGTAQPAQLPFFVAACDYTLIGEEFFAASAYLSGSAEELGSLKGQDIGKLIVAILLIIGVAMISLGMFLGPESPTGEWLIAAVDYLRNVILT